MKRSPQVIAFMTPIIPHSIDVDAPLEDARIKLGMRELIASVIYPPSRSSGA